MGIDTVNAYYLLVPKITCDFYDFSESFQGTLFTAQNSIPF